MFPAGACEVLSNVKLEITQIELASLEGLELLLSISLLQND